MTVAVCSALLGLVAGLYLANLEHADFDAYASAQLKGSTEALHVCQEANRQWQQLSAIGDAVTLDQYRLLGQVGPIVSRAYPQWPWNDQEPARAQEGDQP